MLVYRKSEQWSWLVNKNVGLWTASVKDNISRDLIFDQTILCICAIE